MLKSFLGIFGGGDDGEKKPSAPLEKQEKRKEVRVDLDETPPLTVTLAEQDVTAAVVNVSARGLRLRIGSEKRAALTVGQEMPAVLHLNDFDIRLNLRLVRLIGETEAGFRIRPPFPKDLEKLESFLEPRFLGRSMREIDPSTLQRDAGDARTMSWFQGLNETNLFSWDDATGRPVQQQLVFLERVVEWSGDGSARTGRIRGEGATLPGWVKADLLEFDKSPDGDLISQARVLLENAPIAAKVKETFLGKIHGR